MFTGSILGRLGRLGRLGFKMFKFKFHQIVVLKIVSGWTLVLAPWPMMIIQVYFSTLKDMEEHVKLQENGNITG